MKNLSILRWSVLCCFWGGSLIGLSAARADDSLPDLSKHSYISYLACNRCHTQPQQPDIDGGIVHYVALNETTIWKDDLHSKAFAVLNGPRGKRMGEILKIDVTRERACLACHSQLAEEEQIGATAGLARAGEPRLPALQAHGVSCEACHGPSKDWLVPHTELTWRTKTAPEKAALGMIEVRDPIIRTRLCLSCHLGNADEGKVVTHAMYAAGHPPLPSFEIETFANNMPRHWRYPQEKKQLNDAEKEELKIVADEQPRTKRVAVGGWVAFAESMKLLAAQAEQGTQAGHWPELAAFDCGACHHDLRQDSWRQQRGYRGVPGRPALREWAGAMIDVSLALSPEGNSEDLTKRLEPVSAALSERPFGDPRKVATAARSLAQWADAQLPAVASAAYRGDESRRMLSQIATLAAMQPADYDTARQWVAAMQIIAQESSGTPPALLVSLQKLATELGLDSSAWTKPPMSLEERLPVVLEQRSAFEPTPFRQQLELLRTTHLK